MLKYSPVVSVSVLSGGGCLLLISSLMRCLNATAAHFRIILAEMDDEKILKRDLFGEIRLISAHGNTVVIRSTSGARWWTRWVARRLLLREARALAALDDIDGVPALLQQERDELRRSFIAGAPRGCCAACTEPAFATTTWRRSQTCSCGTMAVPESSISSSPGTRLAAHVFFVWPPTKTSATCSNTNVAIDPTSSRCVNDEFLPIRHLHPAFFAAP